MLEKEFKVKVKKIFAGPEMKANELRISTEILKNKKNQKEPNNSITEVKHTLEGSNSQLDDEEEWINVRKAIIKQPS